MKTKRFLSKVRKQYWFIGGFFLTFWDSANIAYAQSSAGADAINGATTEVTSYYNPAKRLIWVIAGVLGLVGAVRLYNKFTNNDPEASKNAAGFLGGGIALYAAEVFIRKMFIE